MDMLNRLKNTQEQLKVQFEQLDPNDPSQWPNIPRYGLLLLVVVLVVAALWWTWLSNIANDWSAEADQEIALRKDYQSKLVRAVNLSVLSEQLSHVQTYVRTLEQQLPNKAEIDALLSDVNQMGVGHGLQFELFRPRSVQLSNHYAELPIDIRVSGAFEALGLFAADIAALPRIVTLHDIALTPAKDKPGVLVMEGVVKTYRYLDADEQAQRKAAAQKNKGAAK